MRAEKVIDFVLVIKISTMSAGSPEWKAKAATVANETARINRTWPIIANPLSFLKINFIAINS
jgi:hypothetical protein